MKQNHTPGPWIVKNRYQVVRDAGHPLPRIVVNTTISGECGQHPGNTDESNARLIASAPDLLEALEHLIHLHSCEQEGLASGQPEPEEWYKAINAGIDAILKAKGE